MSDDHGGSAKCVSGGAHVVEIVGNRARTKRLGQVASVMAAPADGYGAKTPVREEVQEVGIPAPGRVPTTVNEEQRYRMRLTRRALVDDFEHGQPA
jgi:hypothetical protein